MKNNEKITPQRIFLVDLRQLMIKRSIHGSYATCPYPKQHNMKSLLPSTILAALSLGANAATIFIDGSITPSIQHATVSGSVVTITNGTLNVVSTVQINGLNAEFHDTTAGVSYYHIPVSGSSGDTITFRITINEVWDSNGGLDPNPSWLPPASTAQDFFLVNNSNSVIGSAIDSADSPFTSLPTDLSVNTSGATSINLSDSETYDVSFVASSNFNSFLVRAEFWQANQNTPNNRFESSIVPIPEPTSSLLVLLGGTTLGLVRRRKAS